MSEWWINVFTSTWYLFLSSVLRVQNSVFLFVCFGFLRCFFLFFSPTHLCGAKCAYSLWISLGILFTNMSSSRHVKWSSLLILSLLWACCFVVTGDHWTKWNDVVKGPSGMWGPLHLLDKASFEGILLLIHLLLLILMYPLETAYIQYDCRRWWKRL